MPLSIAERGKESGFISRGEIVIKWLITQPLKYFYMINSFF
jgi:hypothetical protein